MGIVLNQSFKNTVITYIAFGIGGINALFLYTQFLTEDYYGLVTYLLSTANVIMPLTAFGIQYTIIKFFSAYAITEEKDKFLSFAVLFPLVIAIPMGVFGSLFYEQISTYLSLKNPIIKDFTYIIYLVAIATAYFEIFYAWSKVHLQSVFGNLIKELYNRVVVMGLLFAVFLGWISQIQFVYWLTGAYFIRTLIMMLYAFRLYIPKFSFAMPSNIKEVLQYSAYIILAGSAGAILIDIDKVMIPAQKAIQFTAFYAVAVYIGSVIEVPGRAMSHIIQPLTAKAINEGNTQEVASLYKKSSINLLLVCGLLFLLINLTIKELYVLLPFDYANGVWVVFMISIAKLYVMFLGSNGAIISNSKHYKILLPYGIGMALSVTFLNIWLIDRIGIDGAALSTLIVIGVFNTIKLWYVYYKFKMTPFTAKTVLLLFIIAVFFGVFYKINFDFHPILNIALKAILISVVYLWVIFKLQISSEMNSLLKQLSKGLLK